MAETTLPDLSLIWSSAGDILKPSDSKIQSGWAAEVPPRQWFNWLDNRQDQAIAHIAQHGIAVWSDALEYQAGKSYVQGSDGIVYKALTTNTNTDPVGNIGDWESAFLTAAQATQVATAAQSRAMTANNVYLSPLQLANAFTGTNQSLGANGFQKYPGGFCEQWGTATVTVSGSGGTAIVTLPTTFATACVNVIGNFVSAAQVPDVFSVNVSIVSTSQIRLVLDSPGVATPPQGAQQVYWRAIGY